MSVGEFAPPQHDQPHQPPSERLPHGDVKTVEELEAMLATPVVPTDATRIDQSAYSDFKANVLSGGRHASEETAGQSSDAGRHRAEVTAPQLLLTQETSTVAEVGSEQSRGRAARIGSIALRLGGFTAAKNYVKREWYGALSGIAEDRADNHKYDATRAEKKVALKQEQEATVMNREFDLRGKAKELRDKANRQGNLKREISTALADAAELRAESRQRKAQRMAQKVVKAQTKRNDHIIRELELRQQTEDLDRKSKAY